MTNPNEAIDPAIAIPVALILWAIFWLVDTAPSRRARRIAKRNNV